MNLADFFAPSSERGSSLEHRNLLRMPPRSKDAPSYDLDMMGPILDMHPILSRTHAPSNLEERLDRSGRTSYAQLERVDSREKARRDSANGNVGNVAPRPTDVTFYVGRNRSPYTLSAESLKHSTYFASLVEKRIQDPIVLDCEEVIFQHMVLILRYGSFDALPKMPDSELFRLKRELECYGIDVAEPVRKAPPSGSSTPSSSTLSTPSLSYRPPGQPQAQALSHHPTSTGDFPDLPDELKDSSKLVLVSRLDGDDRGRCECTPKDQHSYWALSFHHRHTFCVGCGKSPSSMSPRFLAEMYMAAAMYYSNENFTSKHKWSVGCDSTCSLKLLHAKSCCPCACSNSKCCGSSSSVMKATLWAVSTYHSHAFCTHCGKSADDQTLICILLTLRYGGLSKSSKTRRERANANSEGVIAQESRFSGSSRGSESPHHSRGNRSLWFCYAADPLGNRLWLSRVVCSMGSSLVLYVCLSWWYFTGNACTGRCVEQHLDDSGVPLIFVISPRLEISVVDVLL